MKKIALVAAITIILAGCTSITLKSEATRVIASPNTPPKSCHYLGQVIGNQGNAFTGKWTTNKNLELGAMNDMKNQAVKLGANYIQIITNRAGMTSTLTGSSDKDGGQMAGESTQTNVTNVGNAYHCRPSTIGL